MASFSKIWVQFFFLFYLIIKEDFYFSWKVKLLDGCSLSCYTIILDKILKMN